MPEPYGAYGWICARTPLPQCNLFFRQLYTQDPARLTRLFPSTSDFYRLYDVVASSARGDPKVQAAVRQAGSGLGASCVIARAGQRGSIGDVALVVLSAVSLVVAIGLVVHASRRKAAVGRAEITFFLIAYALYSLFQLLTMSSMLEQASTALTVLSAVHLAVAVSMFWLLLGNAIIATQVVEDGTAAALIPLSIVTLLFFGATLYISLDTGLSFTAAFRFAAEDVQPLQAITLFTLTLVWPAAVVVLYLIIMLWITLSKLRETKPAVLYIAAFLLFAAAQVVFFLASQPLCEASGAKVNSAFISTLLNTAAVGVMYWAWIVITEDTWKEGDYNYGYTY